LAGDRQDTIASGIVSGVVDAQDRLFSLRRSWKSDQQKVIRDAARDAGLSWGGDFATPGVPHFFMEPPVDRETAIKNATQDYLRLTGQGK
jgi:hypothetical protein